MADKVTKVVLDAVISGFQAKMKQASQASKDLAKELKQGSDTRQAWDSVGTSVLGVGAAAGVAFGAAVKKAADFEQAMSYVQAATHESAGNMGLLKDAAIEAGARTVYSATEAAGAIEELSKAGVSTADILGGGLDAALDLAAAGGLDVADAASIAATSLSTFNLSGQDMSHVADLLAAGAGKAQGSVQDLGQALKYVGPVASGMGISIDDTVGTLAAFASKGILADQAGTSLRGVLSSLTSPSKAAKKEMDRLGISLYDGNGKFKGLSNMAGELQRSLSGMTDAQRDASLGVMFGNDQVTAARVLMGQGKKGIDDWTDSVNDQGYAAQTAAMRLDNLKGDLEGLGGAFDTVMIQGGSGANQALRGLVQTATDVVNAVGKIPTPVLQTGTAFTGVLAVIAGGGGMIMKGITAWNDYKDAVSNLGTTGKRVHGVLTGLTKVAAGVGIGVAAYQSVVAWKNAADEAAVSSEKLANALKTSNSAQEVFSQTLVNHGSLVFQDYKPMISDMSKLGDTINTAAKYSDSWQDKRKLMHDNFGRDYAAVTEFKDGWKRLGTEMGKMASGGALPSVQAQFANIKGEANLTNEQLTGLINSSPELKSALEGVASQYGVNADEGNLLAIATGDLSTATDKATIAQQMFHNSVVNSTNVQIGFEDALAKAAQAADDYRGKVQSSNGVLNLQDTATREASSSLMSLVGSTQQAAQKQAEMGGSLEDVMGTMGRGRKAFYDTAFAMTNNADEAQKLTDKYFGLDAFKEIATKVSTPGAEVSMVQVDGVTYALQRVPGKTEPEVYAVDNATGTLKKIKDGVNAIPGYKEVTVMTLFQQRMGQTFADGSPRTNYVQQANGGVVDYYANGGLRETHVAQIAPAGAWRVWAEPETGGEAYIPLAAAKRDRSLRVWQETGYRLGALDRPRTFADGGMWNTDPKSLFPSTVTMPDLRPINVTVQVSGRSYPNVKDLAEPLAVELRQTIGGVAR